MADTDTRASSAPARLLRRLRISSGTAWLAARLRNRVDSEHELTINRLVLSGLTLIYLVAASELGDPSAAGMLHKAGVSIVLYYACSIALFGHLLYRPAASPARRLIGMVIDFGIFSYCVHAGDEAMAPFYPIYLWVIFGNGFRFGIPYLVAATVCGVAAFGAVVLTTAFWRDHMALSAGLIGGLILLPLYVSSLIRKLSDAKHQAEEASRAKSAFLASVSHELRTPLNAIIGLSDLLRDSALDVEQQDMTQTIGQSGRTLLRLINSILDFSRVEAGRMPTRIVDFDLLSLVGDVRRMLAVQAQAKGVRFALHISARTPHRLVGDRSHLEEILINLAGNAVKFTDHGHVAIAVDAVARKDDRLRLRVEVSDTGIGIDPSAQSKIFDSFTQANETIIDRFGGTGLGLAIVKQLVELHGGTIGVASVPGEGSTFWFEIDVGAQAEQGASAPFIAPVVLVSRDDAVRAELKQRLSNLWSAATTEEAVARLRSARAAGARPPIAVIDAAGDVDAAEAIARDLIASDRTDPPALILLTDRARQGMLPEASRALFATTLARPVEAASVAAAVAAAAGDRRDASKIKEAAAAVGRTGLSILIAEDNRINQKVIVKILERIGHKTTVVDNGEAALDALAERDFDLVLMDVNMPVMNGIEAAKLYRFAALGRKHVPIVALTADATTDVSARCAEAGIDACLSKPIEPARLVEAIERLTRSEGEAAAVSMQEAGEPAPLQPETEPDVADAIDRQKLEELRRLGGAAFVDDLAMQFIDDSADVLAEVAAAVRSGDVQAFREQAHALRSGAANIGASGIYAMCLAWREVDAATLAGEGERFVRELEREFARVRVALQPAAREAA